MYFVMACVVFGVFALGFVLAFQGIVGHELNFPAPGLLRMQDPEHPGMEHPPERHRLRLILTGLGLMVAAVLLGIIVL
jgi:hypothetical protein